MKKIILIIIFFIPIISYANICDKISGNWVGTWHDNHLVIYKAQLKVHRTNKNFYGNYVLLGRNRGILNGTCQLIENNEAYLILRQDAPLYNPCRGTLIKIKNDIIIHFYCFNPNQSGYFKHVD